MDIRNLGGDIIVHTIAGKNTAFRFTLPIGAPAAQLSAPDVALMGA
jgi:hypothetical protein